MDISKIEISIQNSKYYPKTMPSDWLKPVHHTPYRAYDLSVCEQINYSSNQRTLDPLAIITLNATYLARFIPFHLLLFYLSIRVVIPFV